MFVPSRSLLETGILRRWIFIAVVTGLALGSMLLFRSPAPFWIDAGGYAAAAEQGRAVVHPPGYIGFLWLARGWVACGLNGYQATQIISLTSYLASIPFVFAACRQIGGESAARWCTVMYAMSWICLNIAGVGTTHASDLLFGAVIGWLLCLPGRAKDRWWWYPVLGLVLTAAVAFRLSTVAMFLPMLGFLFILDFKNRWLWISGLLGAAAAAAILWTTAEAYGGWNIYRQLTAELNAVNAKSGFLSGGEWRSALMNAVRAGFWWLMAAPFAPPLLWMSRKIPRAGFARTPWLLFALIGGCLLVNFGYLCVHPGYLAPMLPAWFVVLAWRFPLGRSAAWVSIAQIATALAIFFLCHATRPALSVPQAMANALFLQYSADTHRRALPIRVVSEWLMDSGHGDLAPAYRRQDVEAARARDASSINSP